MVGYIRQAPPSGRIPPISEVVMGIHRINWSFIEEFNSPGDLRFRIETDIRMSPSRSGQQLARRLRKAVAASRHETVRDLLLERLQSPVRRRKEKASAADLVRVKRLVEGALSNPGKPLPGEPRGSRRR
jgi:hypothetical protein